MRTLKYITSAIILVTFPIFSVADDYLINQEVEFDDFESTQEGGQNNRQALNSVSTDGNTVGVRQDVEGDDVYFRQIDGSGNIQALNLVEVGEDGQVGITWQTADVDSVQFEQDGGSDNVQAINHVEIK